MKVVGIFVVVGENVEDGEGEEGRMEESKNVAARQEERCTKPRSGSRVTEEGTTRGKGTGASSRSHVPGGRVTKSFVKQSDRTAWM